MDFALISDIVKVGTAIIGGALGILAVVIDYKKPNGGINKWGALVIGGIVLSAALGVVATMADSAKTRANSNSIAEKNAVILADINKTLHPLEAYPVVPGGTKCGMPV